MFLKIFPQKKFLSKDLIYKAEYSGWYCTSDELFVSEHMLEPCNEENSSRLTLDGRKPVHYVSEENYKFKLSQFKDDLLHWLKKG